MIKFVATFFYLLCILFANGCAISVGVLSPAPDIVSIPRSYEESLNVVITPKIEDSFEVNSSGLKTLKYTQYRTTLQNTIEAALGDYFTEIKFVDKAPDSGLALTVKKAYPKHYISGAITSVSGTAKSVTSSTMYAIGIKMKYYVEVSRDQKTINVVNGEIASEETAAMMWEVKKVVVNTLELLGEQIANKAFGEMKADVQPGVTETDDASNEAREDTASEKNSAATNETL